MSKKFYRTQDAPIAGVCGGLGEHFNVDPLLFRILFVVLSGVVCTVLIYILIWLFTDRE
jgi:phage shock protein C